MNTPPDTSRRLLRAAEKHRRQRRPRRTTRRPHQRQSDRLAPPPLRQRLFGVVAMAFVALFAVSVSLPALAVNPGAATVNPQSQPVPDALQNLSLKEADAVTILRDGFTVGRVPKPSLPGAYTQTASTYVNELTSPIQWPFTVGVPITTDFGPRVPPCDGCSSFHKGLDMNPGVNTPIQAIADGIVKEVSATDDSGLGVYAIIDHMIDGRLVSSLYAHMSEGTLALEIGQPVLVGQLVGNVGSTGQSTGPHLHFEILLGGSKPTDPFTWLTERVRPNDAN